MVTKAKKKAGSKKAVKKSAKKSTGKKSTGKKSTGKKSTGKKSTGKKSTGKKSTGEKTAKKAKKKAVKKLEKKTSQTTIRKNSGSDKVFVLVNGKRLKNVKELADVMEEIEDVVFNHHVSENHNDFANWLKDVFEEIELAKEVANCKGKKHIQLVLYKHISHKLW